MDPTESSADIGMGGVVEGSWARVRVRVWGATTRSGHGGGL